MQITPELIKKIANLSRLELTESEVTQFAGQIETVLKYVDELAQVNVEGVEPMVHPQDVPTPMREDVVKPFPRGADGLPKVLESAPDVLYEGYKVPQIKD